MKIISRFKRTVLLLFFCSANAYTAQVPQFQNGDRVCFVGDSITHGGSYHSFVYLYYLTRFPEREIRVWNKGISGDRARNVLNRFDSDVAVARPTVSSVMLGMNDVGRSLYGRDKTNDADRVAQQKQLDLYAQDMTTLIGKLDAIDSEIIFITPSIYDQTAKISAKNNFGVNDALGKCAELIMQMAASKDQGYVDFYYAMGRINTEVQREDPAATIVGGDRVHPAADPGHFIMAYQFLKAQEVPQFVSKLVLDAAAENIVDAENCSISELKFENHSLSFNALESALPFPQSESVAEGLMLVPFEQEMNQEMLCVKNLADGDYSLSIDGIAVGTWPAAQFAEGINLAIIQVAPQYQQALEVKELNERRRRLDTQLRDAAFTFYKSGLSDSDVDLDDASAVEVILAEKLKDVEGEYYYNYFKKNFDAYPGLKEQESEIRAALKSLHEKLYQANQPVPHRFSITKD